MAKGGDPGAEYSFMYAFSVAYGHWGMAFVRRYCIGTCTGVRGRRDQDFVTHVINISFSFSKSYNGFYFELELN